MNPIARRQPKRRPAPIAARFRDGSLVESEHPRAAATRFLRERIADGRLGLDPYDPTIAILKPLPHETVWARATIELTGLYLGADFGGQLRFIPEADIRAELGLDKPDAPLTTDEPVASRGAGAAAALAMTAILDTLENKPARLHAVHEESEGMVALDRARQAYDERQGQ